MTTIATAAGGGVIVVVDVGRRLLLLLFGIQQIDKMSHRHINTMIGGINFFL